jgi:hypothetical protein
VNIFRYLTACAVNLFIFVLIFVALLTESIGFMKMTRVIGRFARGRARGSASDVKSG